VGKKKYKLKKVGKKTFHRYLRKERRWCGKGHVGNLTGEKQRNWEYEASEMGTLVYPVTRTLIHHPSWKSTECMTGGTTKRREASKGDGQGFFR